MREVLITQTDDTKFKICINDDDKLTFGPLSPGSRNYNGASALCLRVYKTQQQQRACFVNVKSFREMSIPVVPFTETDPLAATNDRQNEARPRRGGMAEARFG
jgi:hypothetical protein